MSLWVVRAGKKGQQEEGALKNNVVTIGWNELADLSQFHDFKTLYKYYKQINPREKHDKPTDYDRSSRLLCGEVWSFLRKIKLGDLVVLPSKKSKEIFIGKIIGDYEYKKYSNNIKHTRRVEWLKTINKSDVPKKIIKSFGTGLTVFQVEKNDAENYIQNLLGKGGIDAILVNPVDRKKALYVTNNFSDMLNEFQEIVQNKDKAYYLIGNWSPASITSSDYPLYMYIQSKGKIVAIFTVSKILNSEEFDQIENKMSYRVTQKPGDIDPPTAAFLELIETKILENPFPIGNLEQFNNEKKVDYFPQRVGYVVDIGNQEKPLSDSQIKYWAINAGKDGKDWSFQRDNGVIGIGFIHSIDLGTISDSELQKAIKKHYEKIKKPTTAPMTLRQMRYFSQIKKGHVILAKAGKGRILGVGTVTGPYKRQEGMSHPHTYPVDWYNTKGGPIEHEKSWSSTVIKVEKEKFEKIIKQLEPVDENQYFLAMGPWSNWEHSLGKKPILWGVKPDPSNTNIGVFNQLELGDIVFLYVSRHPPSKFTTYGIFGVGRVVKKCSDEKEPYWPDEIQEGKVIYTHRFQIETLHLVENDDDIQWFDGLPNVKGLNVIKPDNPGLKPLLDAVKNKWNENFDEIDENYYLIQNKLEYPVLRKAMIDKIFGINYASGISDYRQNNFIVLISSLAGVYRDKIGPELIIYTGKGQTGDQTLTGGNLGIVNAKNQGRKLYFLDEIEDPNGRRTHEYRFLGEVEYTGHYFEEEPTENRKVIRFILKRIKGPWDLKPVYATSEERIEPITWEPGSDFSKTTHTIQIGKDIREQYSLTENDRVQIELEGFPITSSFTSGYEIDIPENIRNYLKTQQNYSCKLVRINPILLSNFTGSDFVSPNTQGFKNNSKLISFQKIDDDLYFYGYGHVGNFEQDQCTESMRNLILPITSKAWPFCSDPVLSLEEIQLNDTLQKIISDAKYGISGQKPLVIISILYWLSKNKFKENSLLEYLKNLKIQTDNELELLVHNSTLFTDYVRIYKLYQSLGLMRFEIDRISYHIKHVLEMNTNTDRLIFDLSQNNLDELLSKIEPDRAKIILYNLLKENLEDSTLIDFWNVLYSDFYAIKCPEELQEEFLNIPNYDPGSPVIQINQEIYESIMSHIANIYSTKTIKNEGLKIPTPDEIKEGIRIINQELLVDEKIVKEIVAHLSSGRNVLLAGPVGTGKTMLSQLIPRTFWTENCGYFTDVFTATSDWGTNEVVGGLMPKATPDSGFPKYEIEDGCVTKTIKDNYNREKIELDVPQFERTTCFHKFNGVMKEFNGTWLVIDEFNRADIDKAFGQLFTALEYKLLKIPTTESQKSFRELDIPDDYRIIGTLNTADKHFLFKLSDALKRRFAYVELPIPSRDKKEKEIFMALQNALRSLKKDLSADENIDDLVEIQNNQISYKKPGLESKIRSSYDVLDLVRAFKPLGTALLKSIYQTLIVCEKMNEENSLDYTLNANLIPQLEGLDKSKIDFLINIMTNQITEFIQEFDNPEGHRSSLEATLRYLYFDDANIKNYLKEFLAQNFESFKEAFTTKYAEMMEKTNLKTAIPRDSIFIKSLEELGKQSEII